VLGYFWGREALGLRTILGTLFILVSVLMVITIKRAKPPVPAPEAKT